MCVIRRIRKYLSRRCTETLVHAFITARIDYCNSLVYGIPDYRINKLQRIQNTAARLICQQSRFCHITPLLFERSSNDSLLLSYPVPLSKATLGERSFTYAAPKLWNALPLAIRSVTVF